MRSLRFLMYWWRKQSFFQSTESGQTLLIVVLVMVVVLAVGLSLVSRTVINLRTSTEEENSQRAFSAAEAGVERALKQSAGTQLADSLTNLSSYTTTITSLNGSSFLVDGGNLISKDDGADIWFVPHDASDVPQYSSPWSGIMTLYWGISGNPCENAAVEVIVISGSQLTPSSKRYAYDPCSITRAQNLFSDPGAGGGTVNGVTFSHSVPLTITNGLLARVVPLYRGTKAAVSGDSVLPSQGKKIDSIGNSGGTARKISVFQGYDRLPPEFFQYVLFAP